MLEETCVRINNAVTDRFFRHEDFVCGRGRAGCDHPLSLSIRHHTGFTYDGIAKSSYNEARMTPVTVGEPRGASCPRRRAARRADLDAHRLLRHVVTAFDIQEPHPKLEVEARSTVESRAQIIAARDLVGRAAATRTRGLLLGVPARDGAHEVGGRGAGERVDEWRRIEDLHGCVDAVGEYVRGT